MKSIVIFCRTIDADKHPFGDPYYWNGYQDLLLAIKARGAKAYFATGNDTYRGGGLFSQAFTVDEKQPVEKFTAVTDIKADLVYEKGGFTGPDVLVINAPEVFKITSNKVETYRHFGSYQPYSIICQNKAEVLAAFDKIKGERIVAKEPEGNGGKFVYIGSRDEVLAKLPERYPLLVQEFVDTSAGLPGAVEGMHDLRIMTGGGKIFGGKFRMPAQGELRANVSLGGSERYLYPNEIPTDVVSLAAEIDRKFEQYPRYYAQDFAYTDKGWKLIELNAKPGLTPADFDPRSKQVLDELAEYLIAVCP